MNHHPKPALVLLAAMVAFLMCQCANPSNKHNQAASEKLRTQDNLLLLGGVYQRISQSCLADARNQLIIPQNLMVIHNAEHTGNTRYIECLSAITGLVSVSSELTFQSLFSKDGSICYKPLKLYFGRAAMLGVGHNQIVSKEFKLFEEALLDTLNCKGHIE